MAKRVVRKAKKTKAAHHAHKAKVVEPKAREIKWYGWKPDLPDHRDHHLDYTLSVDANPDQAFLPFNLLPPIRDQGQQGSCTGHATRSLGQYTRKSEGQPELELSPAFIYYEARVLEHTTKEDAGAEIRDCIKQVAKHGFASEKDMPYKASVYSRRPGDGAYRNAKQDLAIEYLRPTQDLVALKQLIVDGQGFVFGFTVYENFESAEVEQTGIMRMPKGGVLGGHAVWACGYDNSIQSDAGSGAFLIGNSWGSDWGARHPQGDSRGYFWMPYAYITNNNLCDDFWVIRKIS